ncbi:MAG TPA: universal stress protein, partial [Polyangiaceae bacterium]
RSPSADRFGRPGAVTGRSDATRRCVARATRDVALPSTGSLCVDCENTHSAIEARHVHHQSSMYQRILVAVDLSEASSTALDEARHLAKSTDATLAMIHVIPDFVNLETLHPATTLKSLPAMEEFSAKARQYIEGWANQAAHDPKLELLIEQGSAADRIVHRAEVWGADLIVVGHRGQSGLAELLLGSVAHRVVQMAHCPVLVSRKNAAQGGIVAATDLSDPSLPAIQRGAAEARWRQKPLTVVHVLDSSAAYYAASAGSLFGVTVALPPVDIQADMKEALTSTLREKMDALRASGEALVLYGSPTDTIIECAKARDAVLIVVGTHGRTGLARLALGGVAEAVTRKAPCSVLIVRHSRDAT